MENELIKVEITQKQMAIINFSVERHLHGLKKLLAEHLEYLERHPQYKGNKKEQETTLSYQNNIKECEIILNKL